MRASSCRLHGRLPRPPSRGRPVMRMRQDRRVTGRAIRVLRPDQRPLQSEPGDVGHGDGPPEDAVARHEPDLRVAADRDARDHRNLSAGHRRRRGPAGEWAGGRCRPRTPLRLRRLLARGLRALPPRLRPDAAAPASGPPSAAEWRRTGVTRRRARRWLSSRGPGSKRTRRSTRICPFRKNVCRAFIHASTAVRCATPINNSLSRHQNFIVVRNSPAPT